MRPRAGFVRKGTPKRDIGTISLTGRSRFSIFTAIQKRRAGRPPPPGAIRAVIGRNPGGKIKKPRHRWGWILAVAIVFAATQGFAAGAVQSGASFWETNFGTLSLNQDGAFVWGTYNYAGGKVIGAVSQGVIYGFWWENDDATGAGPEGNWCGPFVMRVGADGRSFQGIYDKASRGVKTFSAIHPSYTWTGTLRSGSLITHP